MSVPISSNLKRRIIAALSLLPPVIIIVIVGNYWYQAALVAVSLLMAFEWQTITRQNKKKLYSFVTAVFSLAGVFIASKISELDARTSAYLLLFSLTLFFLILAVVVFEAPKEQERENPSFRWAIAAIPYVVMVLFSLVWLRGLDTYGLYVFWVFISVWAMDVGGYFAGKTIGGAKLAPNISPSKTWAGLFGGVALAVLTSFVFLLIFPIMDLVSGMFAAGLLALVAQIGDLFESYVKRRFDCKDSGSLIPGHGGILDRVDGLVFAAPACAAAISLYTLLKDVI